MLTVDPTIMIYYGERVLPKIRAGAELKPMEKIAAAIFECAKREDLKGLKSAQELLGRVQAGEVSIDKLYGEVSSLCSTIYNK